MAIPVYMISRQLPKGFGLTSRFVFISEARSSERLHEAISWLKREKILLDVNIKNKRIRYLIMCHNYALPNLPLCVN